LQPTNYTTAPLSSKAKHVTDKLHIDFNLQTLFRNISKSQTNRKHRFWNNIWGTPKIHNAVEWTQKEYFDVPTEQAQKITKEDIKKK